MKKLVSEALILCLTASLIACDVKSLPTETATTVEPSVSAIETTVETTESTTAITMTVPEETVETIVRTQESIDAAWEARLDYETGEVPNIESVQEEEGYKNYITNECYSDLNDLLISIVGEETNVPLYPTRCDGRILNGWNYCISVTECKELSFEDIITDRELYEYALVDYITNHYDELYDLIKEEYSLDMIIDYALSQTMPRVGLKSDGLSLGFDLNPEMEVSTIGFVLPYNDYADLIKPQYLPGEGSMLHTAQYSEVLSCCPDEIFDLNLHDNSLCQSGSVLENYNGHDYYWVYVTYARTGGDIDTPADYYQRYDYEMIFDITDENISYVYARDITGEEIPKPSYSIDDFIEKLNSVGL